jgi:hypothetical protein
MLRKGDVITFPYVGLDHEGVIKTATYVPLVWDTTDIPTLIKQNNSDVINFVCSFW